MGVIGQHGSKTIMKSITLVALVLNYHLNYETISNLQYIITEKKIQQKDPRVLWSLMSKAHDFRGKKLKSILGERPLHID